MKQKLIEALHEEGLHDGWIDSIVDCMMYGIENAGPKEDEILKARLEHLLNAIEQTLKQ